MSSRVDDWYEETVFLRSMNNHLRKQLKMSNKDLTDAEEQITAWQEASGLERGGDPDGVTPEDAKRHWSEIEERWEKAFFDLAATVCRDGGHAIADTDGTPEEMLKVALKSTWCLLRTVDDLKSRLNEQDREDKCQVDLFVRKSG